MLDNCSKNDPRTNRDQSEMLDEFRCSFESQDDPVAGLREAAEALDWGDVALEVSQSRPERGRYEGFIYFIGGECDCVKIGFTKLHPRKRLRTLQTGSPVPLFVLAVTEGNKVHEREFHQRFKADWSHGEWFRKTPRLMALIDGFNREMNWERQKRGLTNLPSIAA